MPVLGDLPFIGIVFSRVEHEQSEEELVILVTPRLVGPMDCDQVPKRLPGAKPAAPTIMSYSWKTFLRPRVGSGRCGTAAATTPP